MLRSDWVAYSPISCYFDIHPRRGTLLTIEVRLVLGASHPLAQNPPNTWYGLLGMLDIMDKLGYVRRVHGGQSIDMVAVPTLSGHLQFSWVVDSLYLPLDDATRQFRGELSFNAYASGGEHYLVVTQWWCDETDMPTMEAYNRSIIYGRRTRQNPALVAATPGFNSPYSSVVIGTPPPPITYQPPASSPAKPRRRAPGPVVGFKLLALTDGVLSSPIQHTRWDTREMETRGFDNQGQEVNSTTGIHSYYSLADLAASDTWSVPSVKNCYGLVVVAVLCTGALALHDQGMRSQRARILAVLKPPHSVVWEHRWAHHALDHPTREHHRMIRQAAKRYRVPVLRRRNFDRYVSEWLVGKQRILAALEDVT